MSKTITMGLLSKLINQNKTQSNDTVEAIIKDIEKTPFGISDTNVLFAGFDEIGGYFLLKTIIIGDLQLKSKRGATLNLTSDSKKFEFKSDSLEFDFQPTEVKGRYITFIDFQIEEKDISVIQKSAISNIELQIKKSSILFRKYDDLDI